MIRKVLQRFGIIRSDKNVDTKHFVSFGKSEESKKQYEQMFGKPPYNRDVKELADKELPIELNRITYEKVSVGASLIISPNHQTPELNKREREVIEEMLARKLNISIVDGKGDGDTLKEVVGLAQKHRKDDEITTVSFGKPK